MKKLTIKTRIALLYVVSALVLCGVFGGILYASVNRSLYNVIYRTLEVSAFIIGDEVDIDRGFIEFEMDFSIDNGVIYSVYDFSGNAVLCNHKEYWLDALEDGFQGEPYSVTIDEETWWVMGSKAIDDELHIANLRVAVKSGIIGDATEDLFAAFLLIIPFIGVLTAIAGVLLARNAIKPVEEITDTAIEITKGDMSRRIHYEGRPDEIGKLALAFDTMLDELQAAFLREKRFTSDVSHELRTPLAVIIAQAEAILQEEDATQAEARAAMEAVYDKAHHMQSMLSQMLLLARGKEQEQAMERSRLDIREVFADVIEELRPRMEEKSITAALEPGRPCYIQGDLMLLTRMAINLVENAIAHGKTGGHIYVRAGEEEGRVVVEVQDDGPGIAPGDIGHIFERFYRADSSRAGGAGAGLGLSFVEWIVKAHEGSVAVKSEAGQGSLFILRFPAAP